jgi:dTDP-4-amino-4,6-dideoxygalactose transaminase
MSCEGDVIKNYYAMVFFADGDKTKLEKYLYKNNIVSDPLVYKYVPLYRMPLFKDDSANCPNAEKFIESIITLPVHEGIDGETIEEMADIVKGYWSSDA